MMNHGGNALIHAVWETQSVFFLYCNTKTASCQKKKTETGKELAVLSFTDEGTRRDPAICFRVLHRVCRFIRLSSF